jgi:hypothetical protein
MTAPPRFVCSDPDAGDLEFGDVEAVLDALEAALIDAATPVHDAARQSWQPVGLHPEIRQAWAERLRFRPPVPGLGLPPLPSMTALVRSLPDDAPGDDARRRDAFARVRAGAPALGAPVAGSPPPRDRRLAALALACALAVLGLVAWAVLAFAARLSHLAASAVGLRPGR